MYIKKNITAIISIIIALLLLWGGILLAKYKWRIPTNNKYVWTQKIIDNPEEDPDWVWINTVKREDNYKTLFVDACINEGENDEQGSGSNDSDDGIDFVKYCNCVADRLESKYTVKQFLQKMDEDPDLNFMFDEVWECLWW